MPGPRVARNLPTGVSSPSDASSSTRLVADAHRRRFDTLLGNRVAMLHLGAEQPPIGVDRVVEILDGDSEMVNPLRVHARGS